MIEFTPLKLLERSTEQFKDGTYKWKAQCGCGKIFLVKKRSVELGETKSCGCFRKIAARARMIIRDTTTEIKEETRIPIAYYRYQASAKLKHHNFSLCYEDFCKIVTSPCHYCGGFSGTLNGIDRKDNNLGYILDNCLSCCTYCNYFKGPLDYADFTRIIKQIHDNLVKYNEI